MDIEKIRQEKSEVEATILSAVSDALDGFEGFTQMTPHSIDINIVDVSPLGSENKRYQVEGVTLNVNI